MVQAWRLYRAHHREQQRLQLEKEKEGDARWEEEGVNGGYGKAIMDEEKRDRIQERRRRRAAEKKLVEIPLLEFTRQVVELLFMRHQEKRTITAASVMLIPSTLAEVRYDNGRHLPRMTKRRGVCKDCHNRTTYRCIRCNVALHPEECFYRFHVPEEETEELD